jgi:UDP-N-acetyl-D-glucosamine dehydrogenase
MSDHKARVLAKLAAKDAKVAVIGIGYVGLPLAVEAARGGYVAVGFDRDPEKVRLVNAGTSYIPDVPSALVAELVREGRLSASSDEAVLGQADAIIVCVPTPLNKTKDPDISFILDAAEAVAKKIRPGTAVVLESTTYPGSTREIVLPRLAVDGREAGKDFFLAFSPERVDPGNTKWGTRNTPKVLGGITPACLEVATTLYSAIVDRIVAVSSTDSAEMVKLLENTFRAVNIGLVNEVAIMCQRLGIDTWEVIQAAATKPFGFMPFYPGPGLGGHCIPVDPHYLAWKLRTLKYTARFIELADEVNGSMPEFVVEMVAAALNRVRKPVNGSKVLVVGVAYKKDVSDLRESPALDVLHLLAEQGAELSYVDPFVPEVRLDGRVLRAVDPMESFGHCDCAVVVTDHSSFDWARLVREAPLVVDTRDATRGIEAPAGKIHRL